MSKSNARQFVAANVKVCGEARPVRFLTNGKVFRATSRGLPRLALKLDPVHQEVIVRTNDGTGQHTIRLATTNVAKAFAQAVAQFWEVKPRRRAHA